MKRGTWQEPLTLIELVFFESLTARMCLGFWILDHGVHCSTGRALDPNFRNIGNVDLIDKRAHRTVPTDPWGTLADYVPFYFTPFSIMMFSIHTGYNLPRVPNEEIVILVSSLHRVAELGTPFVFTEQADSLERGHHRKVVAGIEPVGRSLFL